MRGYLSLLLFQIRTSIVLAAQYRADFVSDGVVQLFWSLTTIVPLLVVYDVRQSVAGWSFGEALMVVGFFTLLEAIVEGAINPSMALAVEQIRRGTFDFVLLKPKDTQFLISTARVLPFSSLNVLTALVLFVCGFVELHRPPAAVDVALALVLLVAALVILYSLWMLTISAAFYVVKIDNLRYLFAAIFDAARWPSSVFKGTLHFVFTFVVPLATMTTFPAEALLGRAGAAKILGACAGAAASFVLARVVWTRAIRRYTSASS